MFVWKTSSLAFFYYKELSYRFFYISLSFLGCLIVSFINIESILFFETYPFLKFSDKKFIVTSTTELFQVVWTLVTSISLISIAPFFYYQLNLFTKSSWYAYQSFLFSKIGLFAFIGYFLTFILCYNVIFPLVIDFLIQWKMQSKYSILSIDIELRILYYIHWVLTLRFFICLLIYYFVIIFIKVVFLQSFNKLYVIMKSYRKQMIFFTILIFFFLLPPDYFLQFFIIIFIIFFYESIFFFLCYKNQKDYYI